MTREECEEALAIMNVIIHMIEKQYDNDRVEKAVDTAIEALKAEPCEDAVSREHLLSEIDKLMQSPWFNNGKDDDRFTHYGYVERKEAVEIVRDLCVKTEPPVTPKQGWIPVSERLPEEHTCGDGFIEPSKYVLAQMKSGRMKVSRYWGSREGYKDCPWIDLSYPTTDEVIAWMPLPEPYKEGESE